ncbi:DUF4198 domain-containing protein [Leeuwenhoekiella sp. A16]|uniref:DUF4198 domain-containing protein n=1 Tax=unclassified Leeuwenhoekiella TaxID=2615029 RepID=UPI003A7FC868
MKKIIITSIFLVMASAQLFAHYMWVETSATGNLNQEQTVRVYFGEYTYGVTEEVGGDAFAKMDKFTLWLVDPAGNKTRLQTSAEEKFYSSSFIPKVNGTYTLFLNNNEIDVVDYTQYDFGIFKTHYHAVAKVNVGAANEETAINNPEGITLKSIPAETGKVKLQVLYKGEPLPKTEASIYVADLWSKKLESDENGFIAFDLPWDTKYIVEVTTKEEAPGVYNGDNYEFIWHCVTYCIPGNK